MLRRFFSYYAPHRRLFLIDFGCAVLAGLLELGFPVAIQLFIDQLLPTGQWNVIVLAALGLLGIYLLTAALQAVVNYWGHMLGINIETEMRRKAFSHVQKLSFGYFDEHKTGQLVGRLTKDLEEIGEVAHHGPEDLFIAVMTLAGALVLMFSVHPTLAAITAVIVPFVLWLTGSFGRRMTENWHNLFHSVGQFNVRIEENIGGIRVVQAFANEDHERSLFARDNANYRRVKLDAYRIMAASITLSYLSMRLTNLVVLVAGAYFVLQGDLSTGGFVGFLLLVNVFFRPIEKINSVIETYPKGVAGFRRYTQLLDTEPEVQDRPGAPEAPALRGDIRFENVSFHYADGRPVLRDINLNIQPGMTVAFVGPSGAGKTTLCALLPRFYDVSGGRITVDGLDIRDLQLSSLREQIGSVQQDVFLFGGTLRENIAYGRLDAPEADILEAVRRARLEDVIAALPHGLDTVVGERGVKLSGGQKQRLAIARMFLKNPPILILDEATSALDTATERAIQASLTELSQGRTTLVIAHRLATIRGADLIVVVDGGRIAEAGTHEQLLARGGTYSELHAAQLG
ncbi:ABC transporter ATP-binding protein [Deinococcus radiophilus]|uniref:ABC transporter ATP-binding protein n=1 Tax=Deinococcus radiophilus TaxID=32062 RepID=A0A3S0KIJ8_9DEIO|nr:ABC transporter ATP-binding protein [Deinococcus radiophilus]